MDRKEKVRTILKHFGLRLPLVYADDYAVQFEGNKPKKMYVRKSNAIPAFKGRYLETEMAQHRFITAYFKVHGIKVSYDTFAILHEIGHIRSTQTPDLGDYVEQVEVISELFRKGRIDADTYIAQYNGILDERNANEWAVSFIKENPEIAERFNSILS